MVLISTPAEPAEQNGQKIMKTVKEKTFSVTTFNSLGEEVETYKVEANNVKDVRAYIKKIIGNSRDNEVRNGRITLDK